MSEIKEITENLSVDNKIDVICEFSELADRSFLQGAPLVKESSFSSREYLSEYPEFSALARSWDTELIKSVSEKFFNGSKEKGVSLINVPCAKVKSSPYSGGLSEDAFLTGSLVGACVEACNKSGVASCVNLPVLDDEDAAFSDENINVRAVKEYLLKAFDMVKSRAPSVIKVGKDSGNAAFSEYNAKLKEDAATSFTTLYDGVAAESVISEIFSHGKLVCGCDRSKLKDAYENYLKLTEQYKNGEIELSDINKACDGGTAVSPEMLDAAVNNILEFSDSCITGSVEDVEIKAHVKGKYNNTVNPNTAAEESVVLLKNDGILPLSKRKSAVVMGSIGEYAPFSRSLKDVFSERYPSNFAGFSAVYDGDKYSPSLRSDAIQCAEYGNVVIVCLGYIGDGALKAQKNHTCRLPAVQEALLHDLFGKGKKIIAVLYGDCCFDMSFDANCAAVLLASGLNEKDHAALLDIIYGKISPGGRLIYTLYENTDKYFYALKNYKDSGRNKNGLFYGYRRYDASGYQVKYPFGYGLSYTNFKYYGLKVSADSITFQVQNAGRRGGAEAVQVYVGRENSAVMRPEKELKAFFKVRLAAGKKTKISLKISSLDIGVYDEKTNSFVAESGKYTVYVGSSVKDIKLTGHFYAGNKTLVSDGEKRSDYFQTVSNIHDGGFTLEETFKPDKPIKTPWYYAFCSVFLGLAFLDMVYLYYVSIGWLFANLWIYLGITLLTLTPALAAILLKKKINKEMEKCMLKSKSLKEEKRKALLEEDLADEIDYAELFEEEFAEPLINADDEGENDASFADASAKEEQFDSSMTFERAEEELFEFGKQKGVFVERESLRALFSAFSSSRLIILKSEEKEAVPSFIKLLSAYFGCVPSIVDCAVLRATQGDNLGVSVSERIVSDICEDSANNERGVNILSVLNILNDDIRTVFARFMKYFDNNGGELKIDAPEDYGKDYLEISGNYWFIITLDCGQKISDLPKNVLDSACVLDISVRIPTENKQSSSPAPVVESVQEIASESLPEVIAESAPVSESAVEFESTVESAPAETENSNESVSQEEPSAAEDNTQDTSRETVITDEDGKFTRLGYFQLSTMADRAARVSAIEEVLWKRMDKLESAVRKTDGAYRISNKLWQKFEKHAAVYLASGGSQEDALDNVLAEHVVYGIIPAMNAASAKTDEKLSFVLEEIFGEGNVPQCLKAIKSDEVKN